jgi:hypothetical protein
MNVLITSVLALIIATRLLANSCDGLDENQQQIENLARLTQIGFSDTIAERMVSGLSESFLSEVLKRSQPHVAYRGVSTTPERYDPTFGQENRYHKLYISSHLNIAASFAIKNMSGPSGAPGIILKFLMPSFYKGSQSVHVFTREQFPDDRIFLTDIGLVAKEGSNPVTGAVGNITWLPYADAVSQGIIQKY